MKQGFAAMMLALASMPAQAICVADGDYSYGGELDAADHVFVATLTRATLVDDPLELQRMAAKQESASAERHWARIPYTIRYDYRTLATLKGNAAAVGHLESQARYDIPDGRTPRFSEMVDWQPGEVVLVVASGSGPATIGFCLPSKHFDEAVEALRSEGRHDLDAYLITRKPRGTPAATP